jgi:peroxiredoxin
MNALNEEPRADADQTMESASSTRGSRRFAGRKGILLTGLVLIVFLVLIGLDLRQPVGSTLLSGEGLARRQADGSSGQPAADFTLNLFNGETFRLSEQRGRAVVLNFWASWCTPCRAEMPYFETTYRAYLERGVVFVGAAVQDETESAQAFLDELGITYPVGMDEGNEIALRYQLAGLPTTIFISSDGEVARRVAGPISEKHLIAFVEEIAP